MGNPKVTFSDSLNLRVGKNKLSLLSATVGLPVSSHFPVSSSSVSVYIFVLLNEAKMICFRTWESITSDGMQVFLDL